MAQLNNDGYLILNLPSSSGFLYKIAVFFACIGYLPPLERLWQKGYFSPHLFYYSNLSLTTLLDKNGFKLVSIKSLDILKIKGLWTRINHNKAMNKIVAVFVFIVLFFHVPDYEIHITIGCDFSYL